MSQFRGAAAGLTIALLATACAGDGGTIYHRTIDSTSTPQAVQHLRGSSVNLVVQGNPFGGDEVAFDRMVADMLHGANPGTDATFVPIDAQDAMGLRRIAIVLNGPTGSNGHAMCGGTPPIGGSGEAGGHIRALAAFCGADNRPLSFASGGVEGVTGIDDPKFRNFLRQLVRALLPMQDPDYRPDHGWPAQDRPDHDRGEWPY